MISMISAFHTPLALSAAISLIFALKNTRPVTIVIMSPTGAASVAPQLNFIIKINSTIIGRNAIIHINRLIGIFMFPLLNYSY